MRARSAGWIALLVVAMLVVRDTRSAEAAPMASVEYIETALDGGLFQYDFLVTNGSDPLADAGVDLFDVALFWMPSSQALSAIVPGGWSAISGVGFVSAFSVVHGAAPFGSDIGPGAALGGFRFLFDQQLGGVLFEAALTNPVDASNPVIIAGEAGRLPDSPVPVPEPGTLMLLSSGLLLGGLARRRARLSRSRESPAD